MKLQIAMVGLAAALVSVVPAAAQDEGLVLRALDEPFSIQIEDMPITQAVGRFAEVSGLSIRLSPEVLDCLPHGSQTRVRMTARNVKLRDALSAMLTPMALEYALEDGVVVIGPTPSLRRIGRRPTFTEVEILEILHSKTLRRGEPAIDQLRRLTGLPGLELLWHDMASADRAAAVLAADRALPCTGADYLDQLVHGRQLTWYVWETQIMIVTRQTQAIRQLRRLVTVEYRNQPLSQVIFDLARKADLEMKMDPGVLALVAPEVRNTFTLLMDRATIGEAFEAISGATGLVFQPEGLALRVTAAPGGVPQDGQSRPRPPFIVSLALEGPDGADFRVFFRPEDLPAELVDRIERRRDELLEKLRAEYAPVPETQPSTNPAVTPVKPGRDDRDAQP
ncbi:MAG: hypothetical protein GX591_06745 [Planctomycetes bacterium]|nr:hypothetical protein [Planctomycetota bacterium]